MHEYLIPITLFVVIGVVLGLFYYYRFRTRAEMQKTVRVAVEKGQELDPEVIASLGEERKTPAQDLRRGMIAVFLAFGIAVFAVMLDEPDAVRPLLAVAALPLFVGIAYLILWWYDKSRATS